MDIRTDGQTLLQRCKDASKNKDDLQGDFSQLLDKKKTYLREKSTDFNFESITV